MIKFTLLKNVGESCTPAIGQLLRTTNPKFTKTVQEISQLAQIAKGTPVGDLYVSLAKAGEEFLGENGTVSLLIRKSDRHGTTTIFTAIFQKGGEIMAKMATSVNQEQRKIGGVINQHINNSIVPGRFKLCNFLNNN